MAPRLLFLLATAAVIEFGPALAQSLQEMQNKAIQQQQSQSDLQKVRQSMQEKLAKAMPGYVERAVTRVRAKGVRFENVEPAMAHYLANDRRYGLGIGRVSYLNPRKTIGVANDYVYFVRPAGYVGWSIEITGEMYWDLRTKGCEFWVDFSTDSSGSQPVGKYLCADFLAGKSDASFSRTFESTVRLGFGAR